MKKIQTYAAIFSLFTLILNGCSNVFFEKPQDYSDRGNPGTDIPDGFGLVQIAFSQGAARTIMPQPVLDNLYLEYWFSKDGETAEEKTPDSGRFILAPGNYSLTVKAFVDSAHNSLAAEGDAGFTITAGVAAETVNVTLHPVVSGQGMGILQFALEYPSGVTVAVLTLARIAGDETINLTGTASGDDPVTFSGSRSNIPVGYYVFQVRLRDSAGNYAGKSEVVHIYQNLTAQTVQSEYTFTANDFRAYLVTNANDAGPGSLRQAVIDINALTGRAIQLMLPPGSVIELESPLPPVTGSVTIEGEGVTLTRAASWTAVDNNSQLLSVNSNSAAVTVRRVHFKNGLAANYGGAVRNTGTLTLESCIFSGSRTTTGDGGAVHSTSDLTIRACTFYGNTAGANGGAVYFDASGKTLTLTGNIFYGNTAVSGYPVAYSSETVNASYNVADAALGTANTESGWTAGTGDSYSADLPVSGKTFKLLDGSPAANVITALPGDYPAVDFYGETISAGGAAGAVQAAAENGSGYYYLELSVNNSRRGSISVNPEPDEDSLVPGGSAVISAIPGISCFFEYWLIDGVLETTNPYPLTISAHTRIHAVFSRMVTVNSTADSGNGTLREALANAEDGDIITLGGVTPGTTTIELESPLPEITKRITIAGNGVTLTPASSWISNSTSQLLRITDSSALVKISGVHFKNGLTVDYGGAVYNTGTLTLESCIFSGNRTTASTGSGGAVVSLNTLTLRGCTFYNNSSSNRGAVFFFSASEKTLTLTGNVFYGNSGSYPVGYISSGAVSSSYNVVDIASGTCGWIYDATDLQASALPLSPKTFKVLYGSAAAAILPDPLPVDYPAVDFYGQPVSNGGAAGAVQAVTASGYSYLDLSVNYSQRGSVSVDPIPNEDGLVPNGSVTLTATPHSEVYPFGYWLVEGVNAGSANPHALNISVHTGIQGVFNRVAVNTFTDGAGSETTPGTLRYALTNVQSGDAITFDGVTPGVTVIELAGPLPEITRTVIIEGNGITLTRATSWTTSDSYSQLLRITGGGTTIYRVHFKDSLARYDGGAIYNTGYLALKSCIFSGNQSGEDGGAVYSTESDLTIQGCTFYGNSAPYGGAVFCYDYYAGREDFTLTGNLFYGNTTPGSTVARGPSGGVSASYNVVDRDFGTGSAQCGWTAGTGDAYSAAPFVLGKTFKVFGGSLAAARLPNPLPAGYPATDFYGNPISGGGAAGAVQATMDGNYSYLEMSVNNSLAGSVLPSVTPDGDGLVPNGITITANANPGYSFEHWLVNGVVTADSPLTISTHSRVQAVFTRLVTVNNFSDGAGSEAVPGTLRYALTNAQNGDSITFNGVTAGTTVIELASPLPEIAASVTIVGNGVTLTRAASWTTSDSYSQLLRITGSTAEVKISGIHFKNGLSSFGGAINNSGILTLESCIFSGNRANYGGGIDSTNGLTIRGCTFYNNSAGYSAGAVYFRASGKTLTLTGNLFYGNTGSYPVGYINNGTVSVLYNVVDVAFGTGSAQCGWAAGTGDTLISASFAGLPVSPLSFRLLAGSGAAAILPAMLPADYPATDFYGQPVSAGGAAGAVQAVTANEYSYLEFSVNDSRMGIVTANSTPDADGLVPNGSVTITAIPNSGHSLNRWVQDGVDKGTANPLIITLTTHTSVQAVFYQQSTVANITYSDVSGGTWTLESDGRRKSPAISGNTVTKSRVSFTSTAADQVITIQLDVSSWESYEWSFISTLDNADATYSSGYYTRISGTQSVTVSIPVPSAGSHFVDIGYRGYSTINTGYAWFKVLQ